MPLRSWQFLSEEIKEWRLQKAERKKCQINYPYLVFKCSFVSVEMGMPDKIIAEKHLFKVTACLNIPKITPLWMLLGKSGHTQTLNACDHLACDDKSPSKGRITEKDLCSNLLRPLQSQLNSVAKWSFRVFCLNTLTNQSLTLWLVYSLQDVDTLLHSSRKLSALVNDFQENEEKHFKWLQAPVWFVNIRLLVVVSHISCAKYILASPAQSMFSLQSFLLLFILPWWFTAIPQENDNRHTCQDFLVGP